MKINNQKVYFALLLVGGGLIGALTCLFFKAEVSIASILTVTGLTAVWAFFCNLCLKGKF